MAVEHKAAIVVEQSGVLAKQQLELSEVWEAEATEVTRAAPCGVDNVSPYALGHHNHNKHQAVHDTLQPDGRSDHIVHKANAAAVSTKTAPSILSASVSRSTVAELSTAICPGWSLLASADAWP